MRSNRTQAQPVTMPRDGTTQTRIFIYDSKQQLITSAQPESGTTTYAFASTGGTVLTKTDAKGQKPNTPTMQTSQAV